MASRISTPESARKREQQHQNPSRIPSPAKYILVDTTANVNNTCDQGPTAVVPPGATASGAAAPVSGLKHPGNLAGSLLGKRKPPHGSENKSLVPPTKRITLTAVKAAEVAETSLVDAPTSAKILDAPAIPRPRRTAVGATLAPPSTQRMLRNSASASIRSSIHRTAATSRSAGTNSNAPPPDAAFTVVSTRGTSTGRSIGHVQSLRAPPAKPPAPAGVAGPNKRPAWDTKGRLEDMESAYSQIQERFEGLSSEKESVNSLLSVERSRIIDLEAAKATLLVQKQILEQKLLDEDLRRVNEIERIKHEFDIKLSRLETELESTKNRLTLMQTEIESERHKWQFERSNITHEHSLAMGQVNTKHNEELTRLSKEIYQQLEDLERSHRLKLEEEEQRLSQQVRELKSKSALEKQELELEIEHVKREIRSLKFDKSNLESDLTAERTLNAKLKAVIGDQSANYVALEQSAQTYQTRINKLEDDLRNNVEILENVRKELESAIAAKEQIHSRLLQEETIRRMLHNQIQELKGNIRVFCRVRPVLEHETYAGVVTEYKYPDQDKEGREIELVGTTGEKALGNTTSKTYTFSFDKVFSPTSTNEEVFEEISQLVQSALDGYNVCIFAYGQTGSGKTYTMTSENGMITRAVHQIWTTANRLKEKGWTYTMEGQFLEIYNENINDLLGRADDLDKKRHEIRHDPKECKTIVTDLTSVSLDTPARVEVMLKRASSNRSVAATKANERSSRSHSVFILHLNGQNATTNEKSEGVLNLIDLAGSERLDHSQSTGERLKETQAINKSLSALGDVIAALGSAKDGSHIPYRNSKLTYLLQHSLGGNSKTLMFVNVSPMQLHNNETLCSLRFATKVNATHIGTAKATKGSK